MTSPGPWLSQAWAFLSDEQNRKIVGWIGAGILAAAIAFLRLRRSRSRLTVSATNGGAAGRDVSNSAVRITNIGDSDRRSDT